MFLGNHFETLVSVLYLDSPETCTKWMFKVYDAVRNNLTASNGKETFLDKEKYIRLYEHQLKPIHFIEYTAIWVANRVYLFFSLFILSGIVSLKTTCFRHNGHKPLPLWLDLT